MNLEEYAAAHQYQKPRWSDNVPEEILDEIRATKASSPVIRSWLIEKHGITITVSTINAFRRDNR